jgi:hypothetical protein
MARPVAPDGRWVLGLWVWLTAGLPGPAAAADTGPKPDASPASEAFFELRVRPTLAGTCFPCHGGKKTSAGLRVDSRSGLLKGGDSGPAVVPGDPAGSLLIRAVRQTDDDLKMPPDRRLPDQVVADLAAWVEAGAGWPSGVDRSGAFRSQRHWAFEPVRAVEPPPDPSGWAEHPVDRFVAGRWRAEGLTPVGQADRRTLIRRLTFDLTGLPPTPEETAAFLADDRPDACERLVDRLLASPAYGERWGRHWLDVARYADTAGDNADYPVPELARYRDYVIDAFNADKPFDAFVREQVAGDLLAADGPPERYAERVLATGFLALSRRYATAPYELWHLSLEDAIETTGRAFLGLSLRCARCHDHKFDPVAQTDYYALYGVFASTTFPYAGSEEFQSKNFPRDHFAPLLPPAQAGPKQKVYAEAIRALEGRVKAAEGGVAAAKGSEAAAKPARERLNARNAELARLRRPGLPPDLPGAYAVTEGKPTDAPLQRGGDPEQPGPVVPRGAPRFLASIGVPPPPVESASSGRRELAEWLTRPEHPLTPRVIVNRVWHHHFGRGIVATPGNLGVRGEPPSHPELLDWLTARFVAGGWSVKALHRLILTSKTYRLSSSDDAANAAKDPAARFLWRFDRRRLDAEALRDALLAVSGDLDRSRPGAHPFPPIERWHWTQHDAFKEVYPSDRRTVYLMTQRLQRHPYLALFDGPDTNATTDARTRSTVPLQALYLMNNPFVRARAEGFASRLISASADPPARIRLATALAWNREPTPDELERFRDYVAAYAAGSARAGASPAEAEREAWVSLARVVLTANEFLYVD